MAKDPWEKIKHVIYVQEKQFLKKIYCGTSEKQYKHGREPAVSDGIQERPVQCSREQRACGRVSATS